MRVEMRTLVERASRWLVSNRRPPLDSQGTVDYFRTTVQQLMSELPSVLTGRELRAYEARRAGLVDQGVPDDLASRVAVLHPAYQLLGVAEIADRMSLEPLEVARLHFALGERLGLPDLVTRILALPRDDRWQTMARAALRDDVYAVHAQLTAQVLRDTDDSKSGPARIQEWEDSEAVLVSRAASTLEDICSDDNADLARMSVGLRVVRGLLAN
jgi:glutamate dehydrogenase